MKLTKAQLELLQEFNHYRDTIGIAANYMPAKMLVQKGLARWRDDWWIGNGMGKW